MRKTFRVRAGVAAGLILGSAVLTAGCAAGTAAPVTQQTPAPGVPGKALPMRQEIAGLFDAWNAALATGNPQNVADLYAPDAVLLPTLSNQIRTNRAEIVDYFEHFLASKPQGMIEREIIDVLNADSAINTGVYRFTLTKNGKAQQVEARYTFVYEYLKGKWLITNHHSSGMPES
jgi:uncharacterized protein (TIGR02246 family)